jgi:hypothetical protein
VLAELISPSFPTKGGPTEAAPNFVLVAIRDTGS